ncbi:uncharacterized protein LOC115792812 [Archocentrus centrarchus]|uniref:uncharacterized protein LOC115792812 n=1 Tax=Archocentrus centrarchus TaxID=63155 RepID=UPI0011E9CC2A|nr:uncharacterized protein LOC115792812 [Archocentrus centrarchus]
MASWLFGSCLLPIALLGWNVHCFPVEDWRQHDPNKVGFLNTQAHPHPHYGSFPGAPPVLTDPNDPAVSFMYDPVRLRASRHKTYPARFRSTPGVLSAHSSFGPVTGSTATLVSGTSQLRPIFGFPPAQLEADQLGHDEKNFEHGNSERGTHGVGFRLPLYAEPFFQPGELRKYAAFYEHGSSERETEDEFPPVPYAYPFALPGTVSQYNRPALPFDWLLYNVAHPHRRH